MIRQYKNGRIKLTGKDAQDFFAASDRSVEKEGNDFPAVCSSCNKNWMLCQKVSLDDLQKGMETCRVCQRNDFRLYEKKEGNNDFVEGR